VQVQGTFKDAVVLKDIPISTEWVHADYGFEAYVRTSEIVAMEVMEIYK
jgi:hypothetical protein